MTTPPADTPSTAAAAGVAATDQDQLPQGPGDTPSYLSHRQILIVLCGVMAGMLLFALDQGIVGTALPRIVSELGGLDRLSWVVTAYLLTSTATTPLWGKISDLYGRRLIFQVAIGIFLLGSALSGLSQNMDQLIAKRPHIRCCLEIVALLRHRFGDIDNIASGSIPGGREFFGQAGRRALREERRRSDCGHDATEKHATVS